MAADHNLDDWPYWSIDLHGLTKDGARQVAEFAERRDLVWGSAINNPSETYTVSLDRDTVEALFKTLSRRDLNQDASTGFIIQGLMENMTEWLEWVDRPA